MKLIQRLILVACFFTCFLTTLKANQVASQTESQSDSLNALADHYLSIYKTAEAFRIYDQISKESLIKGDVDKFLLTRVNLGSIKLIQLEFAEAQRIADSVINVSKSPLTKQKAQLLKVDIAINQRKWQTALNYLDQADITTSREQHSTSMALKRAYILIQSNSLELAEEELVKNEELYDSLEGNYALAKNYFYRGLIHIKRTEPNKAIEILNKARDYNEAVGRKTQDFLSVEIDTQFGIAYNQLGLFLNATESLSNAIENAQTINANSREFILALNSLTRVYLDKPDLNEQDLEKSMSLVNQALKVSSQVYGKNGYYTAICYQTRGRVFLFYGDYDQAIENYGKAAQIVETNFPEVDKRFLSMVIYSKGVTQVFNQQKKEGLKEMGRSLDIALTVQEGFEKKIIDRANYLAVGFLTDPEDLDIDQALKYYHMAVTVNSKYFNRQEYYQNPEIDEVLDDFQFFRSLMGKVFTYILQYERLKTVQSLDYAYDILKLLDDLVDKLRALPMSYEDQLKLSSEIAETLSYATNVAYKLYKLRGDKEYVDLALKIFERSKSSQTLYNLNTSSGSLGIPKEFLEEEKEIRSNLTSAESLLFHEEKNRENASEEKIEQYRRQVSELHNELIEFKSRVQKDFPNYYDLKFSNEYAKIEDVQKNILGENEVLVCYSVDLPDVYSIKIDKNGFDFTLRPYDSALEDHIEAFNRLIQTPSTDEKSVNQYIALSDTLTSVLIDDPEELSNYSKVTFVPDVELHTLPFELLLTSPHEEKDNFRDLSYRIKKQAIHYAHSVTLLMKLNDKKSLSGNKVLAYAPLFEELKDSDQEVQFDSTRQAAGNLAYTKSEVMAIGKHFEVIEKLGDEATEKDFREHASDYPIIHIASHGIIEPEKSIYSKLLFSPYETDSLRDGYLNMREILTLDIPAKMVVLSACNTGSGNVISGEGVLSIASGFFYAGAESVVNTLWTANDQSTAMVMDSFYKHLASKQTKSSALRNAKLEYLEQADNLLAHPYYWAHFTINGNDSPIVKRRRTWGPWLIISFVILTFITIMIARKKISLG